MRNFHLFLNISLVIATQSIISSDDSRVTFTQLIDHYNSTLPISKQPWPTGMEVIEKGADNLLKGAHTLHVQCDDEIDPADCCIKIIKGPTQCFFGYSQVLIGSIVNSYQNNPLNLAIGITAGCIAFQYGKQKQN